MAALLLVGLGESANLVITFSIVAFSSYGRQLASWTWIALVYAALFVYLAAKSRPPNRRLRLFYGLIREVDDPHKARLYLHSFYSLLGILNAIILLMGLLFFGLRAWDPWWGFVAGTSAIASIFYNNGIFSVLGMRYENNRGSSFLLAAAMASLASSMFSAKRVEGFYPLNQAFRICNEMFYKRRHIPTDFYDVWSTVEDLSDLEDPPFEDLSHLADSIADLPRRDELPDEFAGFLEKTKWPSKFETIDPEERSFMERHQILVAVVITIGAILAILPRGWQDTLALGLVGFGSQEIGNLLAALFLLAGIVYPLRTLTYNVDFSYARRYMVDPARSDANS
jgi:hypothetical protein